ncbi:hypothetical protein L3Q82_003307 [Scortum barcoo]|uniref:Uncharacterized protein n=1 Tax=Scortum barcoo TaxID=214431 RepID=A0ACB8VMF7_9TELE|nr:hypothetical protein L3Q82_003307 [Scortum barcoo]
MLHVRRLQAEARARYSSIKSPDCNEKTHTAPQKTFYIGDKAIHHSFLQMQSGEHPVILHHCMIDSPPPLGKSDHNLVHLQPLYTPLVQKQPVTTRSVRRWSPEKESALRDCFNTTVWDVLMNPHGEDIEGMTHCLTDYLNFCADVVSPVKTVRCYPNNKPWVTREVKTVLNKKKAAFRSRDREAMKAAQQEVKHCVKEAKDSYRRKVEQKLRENNMREVWEGVRTITGLNTKTRAVGGTMERANELNDFFNRGWLALSIISSSLSRVLDSATVTRESSFVPTTEPARLISLSSLDVSFFGYAAPPAHHSVKEDTGNHRLVKHLQKFAADVEGPQSP